MPRDRVAPRHGRLDSSVALTQTVSPSCRSEDVLGVEAKILGTRQQHHLRSA